jgi:hypothetical protein
MHFSHSHGWHSSSIGINSLPQSVSRNQCVSFYALHLVALIGGSADGGHCRFDGPTFLMRIMSFGFW